MRGNSGIIGLKQSTSLTTASGKFDTYDQYNSRLGDVWPKVKKLVSISPNSGNHYEGQSITYSIIVSGYEDGDTVYYTILSLSGNVDSSDFKNGFTGSFPVNSSGSGIIRLEVARDATSETETFKIQIRDGSTSGPIIGESGTVTIPNPSYTLTASNSSPNEGDTVTFTLTGTDAFGGTHYFSISGTAANSNDISNDLAGSFSYNGSTGSFNITISNDYFTEGSETFTVYARVNDPGGPIVAQSTVTINDTSLTPTATITPSTGSVNEGSSVTFTVNTTNFSSGTLEWGTLISADMESSDISNTSGTVSISGSTGSIVITATSDGYTETGQTESFQVRVYHPNGIDILATSSVVTINDTSTGTPEPTGTDITSSFYEISNRFISSDGYMGGSSADYTGPYDVGEVSTNFSGSGRVYIGHKITSATAYYSDVPIAGVQIVSSDGSTLLASWIFNTSIGGSGSGWQTYTSQITGSSTQGFAVTPATASGYTYSNINTTATAGRFAWATSTGSSYTGAADGIGDTYKLTADGGSNTLAPVGDAQISQTSSTYYAYHETSSPGFLYGCAVMRSPAYTFSGGEKIRVIHALTGYSASQMLDNDSLYVAVY